MEHERMHTGLLGLAIVALTFANIAVAQPDLPNENHYKVYQVNPPATYLLTEQIQLKDQFFTYTINATPDDPFSFVMERFANPAEKILENGEVFPMVDPAIHQTWWRLYPIGTPPPVFVIDQFGTNRWVLGEPAFLLNPALKNVPAGEPPVWNHYKCYDAQGPTVGRPVTLVDQFGDIQVVVLQARYFCAPVEKRFPQSGRTYPIVDAKAHLACYLVQNPDPMSHAITAIDQFGNWQIDVSLSDCLCVPALKEHVVRTEESTWGRIKAMYR